MPTTLITNDWRYPRRWLEAPDRHCDLHCSGELALLNSRSIAIVGSREATPILKAYTHGFARGLAQEGFTIIAGLAQDIDTATHEGALAAGGWTIACLADPLIPSEIRSPDKRSLAMRIAHHGLLISEYSKRPETFRGLQLLECDRLIAGLADTVIVMISAEYSRPMNVVRLAQKYGRKLLVHEPDGRTKGDPAYTGNWKLIEEGVPPVSSWRDVPALVP